MSDFKSYRGENNAGGQPNGAQSGDNGGANSSAGKPSGSSADVKSEQQAINLAATLAKAFAGKSEGQILSTIIAQAEQGKRDGTLTNADLDNFYNTLAPLLDGFKKKKLQQVIARLKAI